MGREREREKGRPRVLPGLRHKITAAKLSLCHLGPFQGAASMGRSRLWLMRGRLPWADSIVSRKGLGRLGQGLLRPMKISCSARLNPACSCHLILDAWWRGSLPWLHISVAELSSIACKLKNTVGGVPAQSSSALRPCLMLMLLLKSCCHRNSYPHRPSKSKQS